MCDNNLSLLTSCRDSSALTIANRILIPTSLGLAHAHPSNQISHNDQLHTKVPVQSARLGRHVAVQSLRRPLSALADRGLPAAGGCRGRVAPSRRALGHSRHGRSHCSVCSAERLPQPRTNFRCHCRRRWPGRSVGCPSGRPRTRPARMGDALDRRRWDAVGVSSRTKPVGMPPIRSRVSPRCQHVLIRQRLFFAAVVSLPAIDLPNPMRSPNASRSRQPHHKNARRGLS